MSTESVSHKEPAERSPGNPNQERMACYQALAVAFSYPNERFFKALPQWAAQKDSLISEYDRLFRAGDVWLYGAEYVVDNEFERARLLSDIMGFYRAFGIEPDLDRPDAISCELEFMQVLIHKRDRVTQGLVDDENGDKASVCMAAERDFFETHLARGAEPLAHKLLSMTNHPFYTHAARQLLALVETEKEHFETAAVMDGQN